MLLTLQTTTILAEFVGTKQRWSWYPAGVKIRHRAGNSSRQLDQFEARATRKIALRYSVSVGRSERPLRPVPATAPRLSTGEPEFESILLQFQSMNIFFHPLLPSSHNCTKEYLAINSDDGNKWMKYLCSNFSRAEFFPKKLSWCQNEQVCQGEKCKVLWAGQCIILIKCI